MQASILRRQEEKGVTEDAMVGWRHGLNGREFEQTIDSMDMSLRVKNGETWHAAVHGVTKSWA